MGNEISKEGRTDFNKAVTHFAIKADIDPKALEQVFKGREHNLVMRQVKRRDHKFEGYFSAGAGSIIALFTTAAYMAPSYGDYTDNSARAWIRASIPFVFMAMSAGAVRMSRKDIKKIDTSVKNDVQALADLRQQQALLPPPTPTANPGLI